jgi:DNA-binding transcriptional LysR family regulator
LVAKIKTPKNAGPAAALRWDDAKVFLAIWRAGSLKRAAQALGVNISTVSRRLDGLEVELGARLFDRTPDGALATAAAERLAPFAEGMEQAADGFARGLEDFEVEVAGVVRLTAPPGLVDHFLAAALPELFERHPQLRLEIAASVGYLDLARREADIALRGQRPTAGDVVARRLVASGWIVTGSPALVAELGRLRCAKAARWVTWGAGLGHLPDSRWVADNVPEDRVVLRSNGMTGLIEAVRAGLGLLVLPAPYARLAGLEVVRCAPALRRTLAELPTTELWIAGHRAHREIPRIAAVWEWLAEVFSEADSGAA